MAPEHMAPDHEGPDEPERKVVMTKNWKLVKSLRSPAAFGLNFEGYAESGQLR